MESAAIQPTMPSTGKVSIRFGGWEFRHALPRISDKEFEEICRKNPDLRIELDKNGNLLVMPPVSLGSGNHEIEAGADLVMWNRHAGLGMVFSSQTMFSQAITTQLVLALILLPRNEFRRNFFFVR